MRACVCVRVRACVCVCGGGAAAVTQARALHRRSGLRPAPPLPPCCSNSTTLLPQCDPALLNFQMCGQLSLSLTLLNVELINIKCLRSHTDRAARWCRWFVQLSCARDKVFFHASWTKNKTKKCQKPHCLRCKNRKGAHRGLSIVCHP